MMRKFDEEYERGYYDGLSGVPYQSDNPIYMEGFTIGSEKRYNVLNRDHLEDDKR